MAKTSSPKKASALERSPTHLLHRAQQAALDIYVEVLGPGAITQRQYAVLAAVADHAGATQTQLVKLTGIDRSTLADMVARMIRKDLLARERSVVDGRANAVQLTGVGREALEAALPKMEEADARLLKLISGGGRRTTLVSILRDLVRACDEPAEGGKPGKADKPAKKRKRKKAAA
jgi:DNA-binding MarR family transcriptional regulator